MDLIIANDMYLYLKATDHKERQRWLIALATQKAAYSPSHIPGSHALSSTFNMMPTSFASGGFVHLSGDEIISDENTFQSSSNSSSSAAYYPASHPVNYHALCGFLNQFIKLFFF